MKIYSDKLNETERLSLAALFVKAGFTVKIGRSKKEKTGYRYYVELKSDGENREVFIDNIETGDI